MAACVSRTHVPPPRPARLLMRATSWQAVLGELDARIRVAPRSTAQPFNDAAAPGSAALYCTAIQRCGSKEHMRTLQCTIALRHLALKMCKDAPRLLSQAAKAQESFSSLLMSEHEPQGAVASISCLWSIRSLSFASKWSSSWMRIVQLLIGVENL